MHNIATLSANGATTFTWSAGADSTGANTAAATPTSTTTYTVTGTSAGCTGIALSTVTVDCTVGINQLTMDNDVVIYPNPFTSFTTISFSEEHPSTGSTGSATAAAHTIKIINVLGEVVKTITFAGKQMVIEKGEMNKGIYFVQIIDEEKNSVNKKIIIQ